MTNSDRLEMRGDPLGFGGLATVLRCRGYRAVLTATGLETLRRAAPSHVASVRKLFFGNIDDDELPCVERIFARLCDCLQRNGSKTT